MAYSTITKKKCKCSPNCDKWPTISFDGYYYSHAPQEIKDRQGLKAKRGYQNKLNKAKSNQLSRNIKQVAKDNGAYRNEQKSKSELDVWFATVATFIKANPHCWNCGEFIPDMTTKDGKLVPTDRFYRAASAHIFPKSLFQSVATHPLNFLILGAGCGCHHEFDSSVEAASKMKVWPTAVLRFIAFESKITETHKYFSLFKSKI